VPTARTRTASAHSRRARQRARRLWTRTTGTCATICATPRPMSRPHAPPAARRLCGRHSKTGRQHATAAMPPQKLPQSPPRRPSRACRRISRCSSAALPLATVSSYLRGRGGRNGPSRSLPHGSAACRRGGQTHKGARRRPGRHFGGRAVAQAGAACSTPPTPPPVCVWATRRGRATVRRGTVRACGT
jgi:hypothetical protein